MALPCWWKWPELALAVLPKSEVASGGLQRRHWCLGGDNSVKVESPVAELQIQAVGEVKVGEEAACLKEGGVG